MLGLIAAITASAFAPTRIAPLVDQYPAFHDRARRRPLAPGACSLADAAPAGAPCAPAAVTGVREVEVTFPSTLTDRGITALRGTLSIPEGVTGRRPAVVLVGGSGRHTRDGENPGDLVSRFDPPFAFLRALGEALAREGVVVLRYDKRGPGNYPALAAPGMLDRFHFTDFVRDADDALAFLAARPEVDPRALLVAGHSEGGAIAVHLGAAHPELAGVVALSAIYDVNEPTAQLTAAAGIRLRQLDPLGYLGNRVLASRWTGCVARARRSYDPAEHCVDGRTSQRLVREQLEFSDVTFARLREIRAPFFAAQGSVDRNIDPTSLPRVRAALAGVGAADFELHYLRGLNHALVDVVTPPRPTALSPALREALHGFLASAAWPVAR
jgi:alpha-beta hydrolase superfamily lysophospholipase